MSIAKAIQKQQGGEEMSPQDMVEDYYVSSLKLQQMKLKYAQNEYELRKKRENIERIKKQIEQQKRNPLYKLYERMQRRQ